MKSCYVFDIDGTLADCSHRLHFIETEPKRWTEFFAACSDDAPISHMIDICLALMAWKEVVFVSGRSDECRATTLEWLDKYLIGNAHLYMRKAGDYRDDGILKIELLAALRADGYEPIMVFDDRKRVVDAWRAAGIPCAQVAAGDF